MAAACILLAGCASSSDEASDSQPIHPSDTLIAPSSADSQSSPTLGPANADPHGFQ